eukprot:TRINITY_DN11920_c0_g1_i4.p1 TRINITY_DN11920_c0_g1~~TRINITY_DN11920_c0_g1_i4.p1  ORF type:complete len:510 (+),score=137.11 TRINITY_DN11920_c0_g1_i4:56-1531(+)
MEEALQQLTDPSAAALRRFREQLRADPSLRAGIRPHALELLLARTASRLADSEGPLDLAASEVLFTLAFACDAVGRGWARDAGALRLTTAVLSDASTPADLECCALAVGLLVAGAEANRIGLHREGCTEVFERRLRSARPDNEGGGGSAVLQHCLAGLRALAEDCGVVKEYLHDSGALDVVCALAAGGSDVASSAAGALATMMFDCPRAQLRAAQLRVLDALPSLSLPGGPPPSADAVRAMFAAVAGCQSNLAQLRAAAGFEQIAPIFHQLMAAGAVDFAGRRARNCSGGAPPPMRLSGMPAVPFVGVAVTAPPHHGVYRLEVAVDSVGGFDVFAQVQGSGDASADAGLEAALRSSEAGGAVVAEERASESGGAALRWRVPNGPRRCCTFALQQPPPTAAPATLEVLRARNGLSLAVFAACYDPTLPHGGADILSCGPADDRVPVSSVVSPPPPAPCGWTTSAQHGQVCRRRRDRVVAQQEYGADPPHRRA